MAIDWASVFEEAHPRPGASPDDVKRLLADVARPMSAAEVADVMASQRNPFPAGQPLHAAYRPVDASKWMLPSEPLPAGYLSFLRWSNGGSFRNGSRWFAPVFTTAEVRKMLLAYHVPQYMPGGLPFALDGSGNLYVFDMRRPPTGGEYPVLVVAAGNLAYEDAHAVARSFVAACRGTTAIADRQ